jgi:hypothetical protein
MTPAQGRRADRLDTPPREGHNQEDATMNRTNDWYWLEGECYCPACVECDTPAIDAADATRGSVTTRGCCHCCGEAVQSEYRIAYMLEATGEFEIVETFEAADDAAANAYAEANHEGEWYVLDADGNNING